MTKDGKGIFFSYLSYLIFKVLDPKFGIERLLNIGWVKNCEFLLILKPAFANLSSINLANFLLLFLNLSSHDRRRKALKKSARIRNTIALLEQHLTPTSLLFISYAPNIYPSLNWKSYIFLCEALSRFKNVSSPSLKKKIYFSGETA